MPIHLRESGAKLLYRRIRFRQRLRISGAIVLVACASATTFVQLRSEPVQVRVVCHRADGTLERKLSSNENPESVWKLCFGEYRLNQLGSNQGNNFCVAPNGAIHAYLRPVICDVDWQVIPETK